MKLEYGKVYKRQHIQPAYDPHPPQFQHTSDAELSKFHDKLESFGQPCGFLHVFFPLSSTTIPPTSTCTSLPPIPRSVREKALVRMKALEHPLSLNQISDLGEFFVKGITPTRVIADKIEEATRRQFACKRWHEERFARITSSKYGEICKCRQPTNVCTKMLYTRSSSLSSSSLLWGRDHEPQARDQYAKTLSEGWSVQECGLYVSTSEGYLGASPDGLVFHGKQVCGCVEIKCPFLMRDKSIVNACLQPQFFCKKNENEKQSHNYYYQVQGQLAILNLAWCDFVVWTNKDLHIERITANNDFWAKRCLPRLKSFDYNIMLPEIVYPRHPLHNVIEYSS